MTLECLICTEEDEDDYFMNCSKASCAFRCCLTCVNRIVSTSAALFFCPEPGCGQHWNRFHFADFFHHTWMAKEYKLYRERMAYEREVALLPETQEAAAIEKAHRDLDKEMRKMEKELSRRKDIIKREILKEQAEQGKNKMNHKKFDTMFQERKWEELPLYPTCADLKSATHSLSRYRWNARVWDNVLEKTINTMPRKVERDKTGRILPYVAQTTVYQGADNSIAKEKEEEIKRPVYVMKCGADDCRGFVDMHYNCEICGTRWCSKCREIKEEEHECDPEIAASVALIKADSKACPGCKTMTIRVSGCPMMWCTECHVFFDWNTLRIQNVGGHNPHYQEWLERNTKRSSNSGPRQAHNPCDTVRDPQQNPLKQVLEKIPNKFYSFVVELYVRQENARSLLHGGAGDMTTDGKRYKVHGRALMTQANYANKLKILRIAYILQDITEANWKIRIQRIDKKIEFDEENRQILEMFHTVSRELLFELEDKIRSEGFDAEKWKMQVQELYKMTRISVKRAESTFKQKPPVCLREI